MHACFSMAIGLSQAGRLPIGKCCWLQRHAYQCQARQGAASEREPRRQDGPLNLSARAQQLQPARPLLAHPSPSPPITCILSTRRTSRILLPPHEGFRFAPRHHRQHVGRKCERQEAGEQERLSPCKEEAATLCTSLAPIASRNIGQFANATAGDTVDRRRLCA